MQRLYMDKQGRVTIPRRIRRQLGLGEETPLFVEPGPHGLTLRLTQGQVLVESAEAGGEEECVLRGETLKPSERRRMLHKLAG